MKADEVYAILNRKIQKVSGDVSKIATPLIFRGSIESDSLLPESPEIGWMYNIETESVYGGAGMNVAWTGTEWDALGPAIDISLYQTTEKADEKYALKENAVTSSDHKLTGTDLGALKEGDTIPEGTSIEEFIKMITQKAVPPTYKAPVLAFTVADGDAAAAYEVGTDISATLKSVFTKNDAGDAVKCTYFKDDVSIKEVTESFDNNTCVADPFVLGSGNTVFKVTVSYEEGPTKDNNLGNPDPTGKIQAGSISKTLTYSGQWNLFYGVGVGDLPELNSAAIRALSGKKLNPTQNYSWNISVPKGQQYIIFAYPATLRDVSQVMYVETNDTGMASSFNKTLVTVNGAVDALNQPYKVYTYRMAAPAAADMTFKITI